jgi:hypothetical protein
MINEKRRKQAQNATSEKIPGQEHFAKNEANQGVVLQDVDLDQALSFAEQYEPSEFIAQTEKVNFKIEHFSKLLSIMQNETSDMKYFFACHGFRKLLSLEKGPPFHQTIDAGLVPKFIEFCKR